MSLFYDWDDAVAYACQSTGFDETTVSRVLWAKDEYAVGIEVVPAELVERPAAEIRQVAPELFPAENLRRFVNTNLERAFVAKRTSLDMSVVEHVIKADEQYMRQQGIVA